MKRKTTIYRRTNRLQVQTTDLALTARVTVVPLQNIFQSNCTGKATTRYSNDTMDPVETQRETLITLGDQCSHHQIQK